MATVYIPDESADLAAVMAVVKGRTLQQLIAESLQESLRAMEESDQVLIHAILSRRDAHADGRRASAREPGSDQGVLRYDSSRLTFRRDPISTLAPDGLLAIETPLGTFEMTRAQFEADFANVLSSNSYSRQGVYHYPTVPAKAKKYLKQSAQRNQY